MRKVGTGNTEIEKRVRKVLHRLGYRFRLQVKEIYGKPDIVLPRHKTAIFVHGCFWHGHESCKKGRVRPKINKDFWNEKIKRNKERDKHVRENLTSIGWSVLTIWECESASQEDLEKIIVSFFGENYGSQ